MKSKVVIFLFCLLSLDLVADTYFPRGSEWKVYYYLVSTCDECQYHFFDASLYLLGDTLINDITYQIIDLNPMFYGGKIFVREDNNKLYGWQNFDVPILQQERLIVDFSLVEGDSLLSLKWNSQTNQIDSIYSHITKTDRVKLNNGQYAKRIFFDNRPAMIEHVGSEVGPIAMFHIAQNNDYNLPEIVGECYLIDDNPLFSTILQPQFYDKVQTFFCTNRYFPLGSAWEYIVSLDSVGARAESAKSIAVEAVQYVGDTTIEEKTYSHLIYHSDLFIDDVDMFMRYEDNKLFGFSSLDYQYFNWEKNKSEEYLLADFNLQIGDSMFVTKHNAYSHVVQVDTLLMKDKTPLKRITFDQLYQPIVENIVSSQNLFYLFAGSNSTDFYSALSVCYTQSIGVENDNVIAFSTINSLDEFYDNYDSSIRNIYCSDSYYPLTDGVWRVLEIDGESNINLRTKRFETGEDTIINGVKYKKLYKNGDLYAAIRDDKREGKWFISPDFQNDYLMYDFGAKEGDYINVILDVESFNNHLTRCVVTSVKEVEGRRHLTVMPVNIMGGFLSTKEEVWVEGLGSTSGITCSNLLRSQSEVEDSLLCYIPKSLEKWTYFQTINGITCDDIKDGLSSNDDSKKQLFITDNMLFVESDSQIRNIVIYDIQGRRLIQSIKSKIDVSMLSSGLYLIVVKTDSGTWCDKFIV